MRLISEMSFLKLSVATLVVFSAGIYCGTLIQDVSSEVGGKPSKVVYLNNSPSSTLAEDGPVQDCEPTFIKEDLQETSDRISELESQNIKLSRQIEHMDLPISKDVTVPELINRVDRLPADLIYQQLGQIFDKEYIDEIDDPHEFAKQLIDIAVSEGGSVDLSESSTDTGVGIDFSFSPVPGLRGFSNLDVVEQYDRLFVHFNAPATYQSLIVRWQHAETGEILQFSPLELLGNQEDYISLQPRKGWMIGEYQVSVFDLSAGNQLVGTGSYWVNDVVVSERAGPQPDNEIIEDLLSAGLAMPKSY
jgi:hypothetical protein